MVGLFHLRWSALDSLAKDFNGQKQYLQDSFDKIYLDDIMACHKIGYDKYMLDVLLGIIAPSLAC